MKMNRRDFLRTSALTGAGIVAGGLSGLPGREAGAAARSGVRLPAEEIPVGAEADVVVIGGGPGGFGAALAAARKGATTVLIDRYDVPGGVHTTGLQGAYNPGVGGIHTELMDRLVKEGYVYTATEKTYPGFAGNPLSHYDKNMKAGGALARSTFNPEGGACVMLAMLNEAGVKTLYNTTFVDVITKKLPKGEKSIEAVVVTSASGAFAVKGRVFIDGSGTAEVASRAGAPFVRGGGPQPSTVAAAKDSRPIPGGLLWMMAGIDFEEIAQYQKSRNDPDLGKLISAARCSRGHT